MAICATWKMTSVIVSSLPFLSIPSFLHLQNNGEKKNVSMPAWKHTHTRTCHSTFYPVLIRIQFASHPQAHRLIRERSLTCVFLWSLEKSLDFVSVWSFLTVETSEKRNVYRMGHRVTKLSPHNFKCMWYVTCIKSSVVRVRGGSFKRPWRQSESVSF